VLDEVVDDDEPHAVSKKIKNPIAAAATFSKKPRRA
jgi:hypothetical protein